MRSNTTLLIFFISWTFIFTQCKSDQSNSTSANDQSILAEAKKNELKKQEELLEIKRIKREKALQEENDKKAELEALAEIELAEKEAQVKAAEKKKQAAINRKKAEQKKKPAPKKKSGATLTFLKTKHDYGIIDMGESIDVDYEFVNTGTEPLNISNVSASCGCTTPVYPFIPIEPGKRGKISVHFESKGRLGKQQSTVTVYSNASEPVLKLSLEGLITTDLVQSNDSLPGN